MPFSDGSCKGSVARARWNETAANFVQSSSCHAAPSSKCASQLQRAKPTSSWAFCAANTASLRCPFLLFDRARCHKSSDHTAGDTSVSKDRVRRSPAHAKLLFANAAATVDDIADILHRGMKTKQPLVGPESGFVASACSTNTLAHQDKVFGCPKYKRRWYQIPRKT